MTKYLYPWPTTNHNCACAKALSKSVEQFLRKDDHPTRISFVISYHVEITNIDPWHPDNTHSRLHRNQSRFLNTNLKKSHQLSLPLEEFAPPLRHGFFLNCILILCWGCSFFSYWSAFSGCCLCPNQTFGFLHWIDEPCLNGSWDTVQKLPLNRNLQLCRHTSIWCSQSNLPFLFVYEDLHTYFGSFFGWHGPLMHPWIFDSTCSICIKHW